MSRIISYNLKYIQKPEVNSLKLPPCIVNIGRDSYARTIGTPAILQ